MIQPFFDCIVVGLGPAGSIVAYNLARAGWSVLAVDKRVHPRPKLCGGCLSRKTEGILPFSISSVKESQISELLFTFKGQDAVAYISDEPFACLVRREKFDQFLLEKALEAGATVRQGEGAISFEENKGSISVETRAGCYRGRVLVGADGVQGIVARGLGADYRYASCLALKTEVNLEGISSGNRIWIDLGWAHFGYGWIFPQRSGYAVGMADSGSGGLRLKKALFNLFGSHRLLVGQKPAIIRGHRIPLSISENRQKKIASKRVALVGDAAGLVDPLTGEGIYSALWSGLTLATCLINCSKDLPRALDDYARRVRSELHPQFMVAERIARLLYGHPWASFRLVEKYPELLELFVRVLVGKGGFPELLSLLKCKMGLEGKMPGGP